MAGEFRDVNGANPGSMSIKADSKIEASVQAQVSADGDIVLRFEGRLDSTSTGDLWRKTTAFLRENAAKHVVAETEGVDYCDGSGLGLLFGLILQGHREGFTVEIRGLRAEFKQMLEMFDIAKFARAKGIEHKQTNFAEKTGRATVKIWNDINEQISFVGRLCAAVASAALHPLQIRWKDVFLAAEKAGANAVGIIVLIGFLFGLIMAFSSAMPLKQYGGEIYVSDLVAMALVRVLGPFITAIILAGRTGSAFAAELGTMKINDEIDALKTMGLDPMRFLVVPRVIATVAVTGLLATLTNLAGLTGSAVVVLSLGFPLVTYIDHVRSAIDSGDVFAGLFNAVVYGALVGAVGCMRGLQTTTGASAVGVSTTRAVVSGIILIVIAEGIFAVLYYCLGI